jgi:hypothetical protein
LYTYYTDEQNGFGFIPQKMFAVQQNSYNKHSQQATDSTYTIGYLIDYFCSEPDEGKIAKLQSVFDSNMRRLNAQKEELETALERLQSTEQYMFETQISFKHYEIPGTPKVLPPEPQELHYRRGVRSNDKACSVIDIENTISKFCPDEYKNATYLVLCPSCKAMFAISSYGSLSYKYVEEEKARMDDWDDDY